MPNGVYEASAANVSISEPDLVSSVNHGRAARAHATRLRAARAHATLSC